jgi:hypothetical protein
VSFYTEDPKYTAEGTDQYGSNVIFRSVFENKSNEPQTHSLKTFEEQLFPVQQLNQSCILSSKNTYMTQQSDVPFLENESVVHYFCFQKQT